MARKILLADDSVTAQNMGRKILADAGYEVITVNNGSAALKKIAEQKPDLIVLDVYMPGYSGLEVCQRLKEAGDTSRIPVLLTVGKLEPFKPEEARRVRADGYIVKPFEASELLSALSKLEDKVVPRSEPSKPGRFARATAAIEESRFDKSMAVDEDSGWKSRIVFPKKKEKPPEPEVEETAIYNPVNKDLRTVIEHKDEEHAPAAQAEPHTDRHSEEERVNLGALAPEGLPKDVTPEEIAALAAAAAQVKSTLEEHKTDDEKAAAPNSEVVATTPAEVSAVPVEAKTAETKEESFVSEPVAAADAVPAMEAAAAPGEQPKSEKTEKEAGPETAATPSEVMAAIIGLEHPSNTGGSGNGSWSHGDKADEPVTMAVAASAAVGSQSSRWTAVATAVAPEEASLSLEQEMQKAYAAFAAAETSRTEAASEPVAASISEPPPAPAAVETPTAHSDETPAPVSIPAVAAPEAASSFAEVASTAQDAVSAAISELESVAASYAPKESVAAGQTASVFTPEPAAPTISEPAPVVEAKSEETVVAESSKSVEAPAEAKPEATEAKTDTAPEIGTKPSEIEAKSEEAEAKPAEPVAALEEQPSPSVEEKEEKKEIAESVAEASAPAPKEVEISEAQASPKEVVPEVAASEAASSTAFSRTAVSPIAGGIEDMAKKESENTAAAAWASWRKIRETGGSKSVESAEPANENADSPVDRDSAAMAVAVGAESSPEDVNKSLDSDPEIASIVDSVLADMRPKIVEEIARKLGKKK